MSKTIMIVEDDSYFQDLYEAMLEDTNYEIIRAYDGIDALGKLEEKRPDLIILDIMLNMVSGDEFLLYLKKMPEYKDIPIIIVSSVSRYEYKIKLNKIDPNIVFIEKDRIGEKLEKLVDKIMIGID